MPNTHLMQEVTRGSFDNYLDAVDDGQPTANPHYLCMPKGKNPILELLRQHILTASRECNTKFFSTLSWARLSIYPSTITSFVIGRYVQLLYQWQSYLTTKLNSQSWMRFLPSSIPNLVLWFLRRNGWKGIPTMKHILMIQRSGWASNHG